MDLIIIDGDTVEFSSVGAILLLPLMPKTIIKASGATTINGKKVCIEGDEKKVELPCSYTMPPFTIPGSGTLKIKNLSPDQLTQKSKSGNKSLVLKGKVFTAIFEIESPAKQPPPANIPDPVPFYIGQGKFISSNSKSKAT